MQYELPETSEKVPQTNSPQPPPSSSQHGFHRLQQGNYDTVIDSPSDSALSQSVAVSDQCLSEGVDALQLNARLRRLSGHEARPHGRRSNVLVAGQRIAEYEKALIPTTTNRIVGFTVIRSRTSPSDGVRLTDFPNEILTHVLSHLHPDSHSAVALLSKRFYALVTTPHAWRMAFIRYFPGHEPLDRALSKSRRQEQLHEDPDVVRSEIRCFTRLTTLASWRSEYLLRTRLLRSVARGKPGTSSGGIGAASRSSQSGKKASAVLTYNSKLAWTVTNLHAVFTIGKKAPRVIHGSSDFGISTISDPTSGKVEKWGTDDPFAFAQLHELFPQSQLYGLGDGHVAVPNVMDVSQPYGVVGGEGFPGGRAFFRSVGEHRGRYLGAQDNAIDPNPEMPKIPELSEAICSLWIAKSSAVPSMTQSMVGIMTGSSLGVVTAYALGYDSSGRRYANGDITARWVLSPGVPIVALKVDDNYNARRKSLQRVWAVALNALGEIYYLHETPTPESTPVKVEDVTKAAWHAGRTAYWELIEATRRTARADEFDKNVVRGAYSPRSPCNAMNLSIQQLIAEAREIEKFFRHKPAHFRKVCEGWDMRRKLEVDFAGGNEGPIGEAIFVITCGNDKDNPPAISRYTRCLDLDSKESGSYAGTSSLFSSEDSVSIFGSGRRSSPNPQTPLTYLSTTTASPISTHDIIESGAPGGAALEGWRTTVISMAGYNSAEITASAVDQTLFALPCPFEDPLRTTDSSISADSTQTPTSTHATGEIPGRRSRLMAIGTKSGAVLMWNMRDTSMNEVQPLRVIQTDSPEVSSLAVSALYLLHGGSDGLVQAWDPLTSTIDPLRTLNSRSSGRVPRHLTRTNPAIGDANFSAVGAIFLDPDPTILRGVLSFGTFIRYWTYSTTGQTASRKRRNHHSDIHGRLATRRQGGTVLGYIAAEAAELRHEQEYRQREEARLRNRFGVGLGDLTEEEAIRYAQMISEESFVDDQRRLSASDTGSAADVGETASSTGSISTETVTPEPSVSGISPPAGPSTAIRPGQGVSDDDYELQIQQAIRLSLLEGVNDVGQSPRDNSSGEYDFQVKYKSKKAKSKRSASSSPTLSQSHTPLVRDPELATQTLKPSSASATDNDFELALRLSLEEEQNRQNQVGLGIQEDFPALGDKGKGKQRQL